MIKLGSFLLLCLGFAWASSPVIYNINDFLDRRLEEINKNSTLAGVVETTLEDSKFNGAYLSNVTMFGLNTLKRTGECYEVRLQNGTIFKEVHIGLQFALVSINKVVFEEEVSSAIIISHNNSIYYAFEMNPASCYFKITNFEFDFLEWTTYAFPTPRRNTFGCLEEELKSKMAKWKTTFEESFEDICKNERNSTFTLQNPSPLAVLHSLVSHY